MNEKNSNRVKTSEKTLRVLRKLSKTDRNSLAELADEFEMDKSTLHRHLSTLVEQRYVAKDGTNYYVEPTWLSTENETTVGDVCDAIVQLEDPDVEAIAARLERPKTVVRRQLTSLEEQGFLQETDGRYRIGLKFLQLGGYERRRFPIYEVGRPRITELSNDTGELANLLIEEDGEGVYLYQAYGKEQLSLDSYIGSRTLLHCTALGKAILSQESTGRVEEIIEQHGLPAITENTTTDREELFSELEGIRDRGFALDDQERIDGLRCVAVPIATNEGDVLGAISVSAPISRMRGDRFESEIPQQVLSTANLIELEVDYN